MNDNIYERLSERRKVLQAEGLIPDWYTTGGLQLFEAKYEYQTAGRSVRGQFERIASTAASYLKGTKYEAQAYDKFFELMWNGWISLSTPVMANTGTTRGLSVSCSGTYVDDSIDGFYSNLREVAILTKNGFGTASYLGNIRPRGSKISAGGKASGVLPVMKDHIRTMSNVSQGSSRRGAWAGYIEITHGDFDELVDFTMAEPDDCNLGWIITDKFIADLNAGDVEAIRRFQRAMKLKMVTGRGYFCFIDKANRKRPKMYVDKGLTVKSFQLCNEISLFSDKDHTYSCILSSMNVSKWEEWKDTDAVFWATVFLDCIAEDFIQHAKKISGLEKVVRFTEKGRSLGLGQAGLHTLFQKKRIPFESIEAFFLSTEIAENIAEKSLLASQDMAKELGEPEWCVGYGVRNTHRCVTGDTKILTKSGQVNIEDVVDKTIEVWNGQEWSSVTPFKTGVSKTVKIKFSNGMELDCTPDHKFLIAYPKREVKEIGGLKLIEVEASKLRIGDCLPKFFTEPTTSDKKLPYAYESGIFCGDGSISNSREGKYPRNELRLYGEKMSLSDGIRWKSSKTWGGDSCVRGYLSDEVLPKYTVPFGYSLDSKLEWLCGLIDSDGCSSSGGIIITMKDKSFSQNVALLVQECGGDVSSYEAKRTGGFPTKNPYYYCVNISIFSCNKMFSEIKPRRVKFPTQKRGVSKIGSYRMTEIVEIEENETEEMTYCFTEPKLGRGIFNGVLTKQCAVAPTKSSALLIGGVSEGINPDPAMTYTQNTAAGDMDRITPILYEVMKERGVYNKKTITDITSKMGSVQHVDWLDDHEKLVFRTAFEMNQEAILRMAAQRGNYIDQWQSLNLFFSSDADPAEIARVHQMAFGDERILGLYYVYSKSGVQAATECIACQ